MKKILKSVLALSAISMMLISCEDEQNLLIASAQGEYEILSPTTGDEVVLDPLTTSNPGLSITWAKADYGVTPTVIYYAIEIDKTGDNFDTPVVLTTSTNTFATVNSEALNSAALEAGLTPFSQGSLDIRISASVGTPASDMKLSNTITYLVTPYSTDLPKLYVTGNFLSNSGYGNNWTPANGVPIAAASFSSTDYEGFVNINEASYAFLFLPTNTSFDNKFGDDGSFSGTLQAGGSDITGTGANYYLVKANTTSLTYSLQPAQWAITGAATPLGNKFKFRANDAWALNLGGDSADADSSMDFGGPDLEVPAAGTYKIELDLSQPRNYTWTATLQ